MDLGIENAVKAVLLSLTNPAIAVLDRDFAGDAPVDDRGRVAVHARFQVVVAPSAPFALRRGGTILRRGFVQIDVYSPESAAQAAARTAGERIVDLFPRLTRLGLSSVERPAYASQPLKEAPYYRVPVTVPWNARVLEGV